MSKQQLYQGKQQLSAKGASKWQHDKGKQMLDKSTSK